MGLRARLRASMLACAKFLAPTQGFRKFLSKDSARLECTSFLALKNLFAPRKVQVFPQALGCVQAKICSVSNTHCKFFRARTQGTHKKTCPSLSRTNILLAPILVPMLALKNLRKTCPRATLLVCWQAWGQDSLSVDKREDKNLALASHNFRYSNGRI